MGDWSLMEGQLVDTVGEDLTASRGTVVNCDPINVNTKGAWVQLVAATTYAADTVMVNITNWASDKVNLTDIGVGAAGSEQVVIPNLLTQLESLQIAPFLFPISIPAGSRIAVRTQSNATTGKVYVTINLLSQGFLPSSPLQRVTAYGPNTGTSRGVSVDPGGTLNTKNAYSQINGTTAAPIRALVVAIGNQANATMTSCEWLFDVAKGAAASEQIILPDLYIGAHATPDEIIPVVLGPFFVDIPSGVRLAARAQCNIIDATDRLFDIALYGID